MFLAIILYIIARWSRNEPAVSIQVVVSGAFAILIIALLDHGRTEEIAKGFAWLFFIGAAYNAIPALGNVTKTAAKGAGSTAKKTVTGTL
jgi:hypothetical protein